MYLPSFIENYGTFKPLSYVGMLRNGSNIYHLDLDATLLIKSLYTKGPLVNFYAACGISDGDDSGEETWQKDVA